MKDYVAMPIVKGIWALIKGVGAYGLSKTASAAGAVGKWGLNTGWDVLKNVAIAGAARNFIHNKFGKGGTSNGNVGTQKYIPVVTELIPYDGDDTISADSAGISNGGGFVNSTLGVLSDAMSEAVNGATPAGANVNKPSIWDKAKRASRWTLNNAGNIATIAGIAAPAVKYGLDAISPGLGTAAGTALGAIGTLGTGANVLNTIRRRAGNSELRQAAERVAQQNHSTQTTTTSASSSSGGILRPQPTIRPTRSPSPQVPNLESNSESFSSEPWGKIRNREKIHDDMRRTTAVRI